MKKTITFLLALVMVLSLAACGGGKMSDELMKKKESVFSSNDSNQFAEYIYDVREEQELNDDLPIIECFPYQETVSFITSNCESVVSENNAGGYYDTKPHDVDEDFWYDPLENKKVLKGEVGTYHYTTHNFYLGDIHITTYEKKWFDTPSSDPNNSLKATMWYQGEVVSSDYVSIQNFLHYVDGADVYSCGKDNYKRTALIVVSEDNLTIIQNELFFIKYK